MQPGAKRAMLGSPGPRRPLNHGALEIFSRRNARSADMGASPVVCSRHPAAPPENLGALHCRRSGTAAREVQQSQLQRGVLTHIPAWAGTEDACLRDERRHGGELRPDSLDQVGVERLFAARGSR